MTAWTPLNTLIVVCVGAVVLSLCLGRVALAIIRARKGDTAGADSELNAIETAAQKAAEAAVQKFLLARPQQTTVVVPSPVEPTQPRIQT